MMDPKRFSQACENNKEPILAQLKTRLRGDECVLEIGSGTGQHVAHFAFALPSIQFLPTDVAENHASIVAWCAELALTNVAVPQTFFIGHDTWRFESVTDIYTANTAHIMQPIEVETMMGLVGEVLPENGRFFQYGPFKVDGQYTSDSNRAFDHHLRQQGYGGIQDLDQLQAWGTRLILKEVIDMPANNLLLVWHRA